MEGLEVIDIRRTSLVRGTSAFQLLQLEESNERRKTRIERRVTLLDTIWDLERDFKDAVMRNPHPELGSYIQIMNVLYYGGSTFFNIPVYIAYDEEKRMYVVKKCNELQRVVCMLIQLIFCFSCWHRVSIPARALWNNKSNIVPYFDLVNESVLNFYIYWHFYIHWFELERIEKYIHFLQTTTLLRFDKTPCWKGKIFPALFWPLCLYLSFNWIRAIHGVDMTSWAGFLQTGEKNARQIFWLDEDEHVSKLASVLAVISRWYNCFFHHSILNNYTPVSMLPVLFINMDFYSTILKTNVSISEVLDQYQEYKKLVAHANHYMSQYLFYYVSMTVTFNSVHLFDTLNTPEFLWMTNMYVYDFDTWFIMWIPTKILLNGKKMKKWLWKDENFLKIPRRQLALILHDMVPWIPRKGIRCGNMVVSSEFTGGVIANMWSYSLMVSLSGH